MILWEIDWREPAIAFAPLAGEAHAHLLHGGEAAAGAQWSIIAAFPSAVVETEKGGGDPFPALDEALASRAQPKCDLFKGLPFVSGALGFVGYEAARFFEPSLELPSSPFLLPDVSLGLYDAAALFSRETRKAYLVGRDERACRRLRGALGRDGLARAMPAGMAAYGPMRSNFTAGQYRATVANVIEDILDGAYYQANISQQLSVESDTPVSAFDLFRAIAVKSDAPHGALLQYEKGVIVSNSPERFFRIEGGAHGARRIVAEPIKGTRPRGDSPESDAALARQLLCSPKDRAENIMIADLLRNDLSRICKDGTIREDDICALMSLVNVHHLVSRISGSLREDVCASDIFAALFPCGSVTGAPKIAAMKAIARAESSGRGPYCAAIR